MYYLLKFCAIYNLFLRDYLLISRSLKSKISNCLDTLPILIDFSITFVLDIIDAINLSHMFELAQFFLNQTMIK